MGHGAWSRSAQLRKTKPIRIWSMTARSATKRHGRSRNFARRTSGQTISPAAGQLRLSTSAGGWLPGDITKFFAAQGLAGKEPKVTDHSLEGAAADNGNSSAPNEAEAGAALDEADAEVALDIQIVGAAYAVATGKPAAIRVYWAKDLATGLRAAQCQS